MMQQLCPRQVSKPSNLGQPPCLTVAASTFRPLHTRSSITIYATVMCRVLLTLAFFVAFCCCNVIAIIVFICLYCIRKLQCNFASVKHSLLYQGFHSTVSAIVHSFNIVCFHCNRYFLLLALSGY